MTPSRIAAATQRALRALCSTAVVVLAAPSALGLLYLLRAHDGPVAGPLLRGALPLQQLAGGDVQPLSRVVIAFGAAGLAAGVALGLLTRTRPLVLALLTGVLGWTLLFLTGAASDAIANAYRFGARLQPQLTHRGLWVEAGTLTAAVLLGGWLARRAQQPRRPLVREGHAPAQHARAAQLVALHAHDSLDPFALREDKSFHFADGGMLAYRVLGRTAVVGGDPIGPPENGAGTLRSFERAAAARGLKVVLTGVSPERLEALRGCGYRALQIGLEAVVDPRGFSLDGRRVRKLRQSVTRADRLGWRFEVASTGELDDVTRDAIEAVEQSWRARQPRLQGFAMTLGRLWGAPEDEDALFVLARDPAGMPAAFLRFVRYPGGLSLDAMRRAESAPNGLCEAMVATALTHAAAEGVTEVSLNFAGFGHVMSAEPAALPPRQRALRWLLRHSGGRFQLERLSRFNAKFTPVWRPRYLLYRGRLGLPLAGLRVLQAEAYVAAPHARELRDRWRATPLPAPVSVPDPVPDSAPQAAPALLHGAVAGGA